MRLVEKLVEEILEDLISHGDVDICDEYGEPGYSLEDGKKAILFGDWNPYDKYPNLMEYLEENYQLEWHDEWIISYEHGKAYRTQPDSYSWQQSFKVTEDGDIITRDDDVEEWIEHCKIDSRILGHTPSALPSFVEHEDLVEAGFELIDDDLESGMYNRHDDPNQIAEDLLEAYEEVVFRLSGVGQFAVNFEVYARR